MIAYAVANRGPSRNRKPIRHPKYLKFVRGLPCAISGASWGVEACHTGDHGLRQKSSDLDAIPLNRIFHRPGYPFSYHTLGRVQFEKHHGVSISRIITETQLRADIAGIDLAASEGGKRDTGGQRGRR
jgi:hypothetical protein